MAACSQYGTTAAFCVECGSGPVGEIATANVGLPEIWTVATAGRKWPTAVCGHEETGCAASREERMRRTTGASRLHCGNASIDLVIGKIEAELIP
jgi:hypothetical protein